jgi:hypothetical protein
VVVIGIGLTPRISLGFKSKCVPGWRRGAVGVFVLVSPRADQSA